MAGRFQITRAGAPAPRAGAPRGIGGVPSRRRARDVRAESAATRPADGVVEATRPIASRVHLRMDADG